MLSRVANSLFWLSRYMERAENVARFIDVNLTLILDLPVGEREQWEPLVATTGDHEEFFSRYGVASRENVIQFLTFDLDNPNSILSCFRFARENARTVRESVNSEMWEGLNTLYLDVMNASRNGRAALDSPHEFFSRIKAACYQFLGSSDATMPRDEGWHFCRLGRVIERADKTSRILDVKYYILLPSTEDVGAPYDDIQWGAVLHSASGFESYRRRYGRIRPSHVVEFLVLERWFPRSVLYCLAMADESLHAITGSPRGAFGNLAEQRLGQLHSQLAYLNIDEIIKQGLHEFVDSLQTRLNLVGDAIQEKFFAVRPVAGAVTMR